MSRRARISMAIAVAALLFGIQARQSMAVITLSPSGTVPVNPGSSVYFVATSGCPATTWTWSATGGTGQDLGWSPQYPYIRDHYGRFTANAAAGTFMMTVTSPCGEQANVTLSVPPLVVTIDPIGALDQGESRDVDAHINSDTYQLTWSVTPGCPCTFGPQGYTRTNLSAQHGYGNFQLTATSVLDPSVSATAPFTIRGPATLSISPHFIYLGVGKSAPFTASVANVVAQTKNWTIDQGGVLGLTLSGSGATQVATVTAGSHPGAYHLYASSTWDASASDTATINVVSVDIAPTSATIKPGTSRAFVARVEGVVRPITWSTTVPGATITGGVLSVPASAAPGSYTVKATAFSGGAPEAPAEVSKTINISVATNLPAATVALSPPTATLDPGASRQMSATVNDVNGDPVANQAVSWSATAPSTITAGGLFTAPSSAGTYTVTAAAAADPSKTGSGTIRVTPSLSIDPTWISLGPGASADFAASAPGLGAIAWSVREGAAGGTITAAGHYQAPSTLGTYHIIATPSGSNLQAVAVVTVTNAPNLFVEVTPDLIEVPKGSKQLLNFSASVMGTANQEVTWSATAGTISSKGQFSPPPSYGTVTITATSVIDNSSKGTATVVVTDGGSGQILSYDANGNLLSDGNRVYEWDGENRLVAIVTNGGAHRSEFLYDAFGRRVLQTEKDYGSVVFRRRYIWVGSQIIQEIDSPVGSGFPSAPVPLAAIAPATDPTDASLAEERSSNRPGPEIVELAGSPAEPARRYRPGFETVALRQVARSAGEGSPRATLAGVNGGYFDGASCQTISGWAWDQSLPNTPINVKILDGSTVIATIPADQFRQDLLAAGIGNGYHAFWFTTPASLKNGVAHSITVQFASTGAALAGSPKSLTCAAPAYAGTLDAADCQTIAGWAWDPAQPNTPLNVDIMDGATVLATVSANAFRQDLANAGVGNGYHGFWFTTPASVKTGTAHSIGARIAGTAFSLGGSPKSLTCPAANAAAFVSQSAPTTMTAGATYAVSVTMKNTGTNTWTAAANYRLGNWPAGPSVWTTGRADLASSDAIATNQSKTFTFSVTAPTTAGTYSFQWSMLIEGVAWIPDPGPSLSITVVPAYAATFMSQSVPATMTAGASYPVSVTMKNTGGNTWTAAENYKLGCLPMSGACPFGVSRVNLSGTDAIATGQQKTFAFNVTAPTTPGTATFQYEMLREMVTWIDQAAPAVAVAIQPAPETAVRSFYPGGMVESGVPYYFSYDQLGSVREIVDGAGAIRSRYDYDAWGRITILQGPAPRFGYAGYFYHGYSGLYLTRTRAYDADLGRWISPDPIEERGGNNLYQYSANDPEDRSDPSGLSAGRDPFVPVAPPPWQCKQLTPLPVPRRPIPPMIPLVPRIYPSPAPSPGPLDQEPPWKGRNDPNNDDPPPVLCSWFPSLCEWEWQEPNSPEENCVELGICDPYSPFHPGLEDNPHGSPLRDDAVTDQTMRPGLGQNGGPGGGLPNAPRIPNGTAPSRGYIPAVEGEPFD